jgi:general stress protein CsbA
LQRIYCVFPCIVVLNFSGITFFQIIVLLIHIIEFFLELKCLVDETSGVMRLYVRHNMRHVK